MLSDRRVEDCEGTADVRLPSECRSQEGWWFAASYRPAACKRARKPNTVQVRATRRFEVFGEGAGMDGVLRFERCLPLRANAPEQPKVSRFSTPATHLRPVAGGGSAAFRKQHLSVYLYEDNEASSGSNARTWREAAPVFGRLPPDRRNKDGSRSSWSAVRSPGRVAWASHQLDKINANSHAEAPPPGNHGRFAGRAIPGARPEGSIHWTDGSAAAEDGCTHAADGSTTATRVVHRKSSGPSNGYGRRTASNEVTVRRVEGQLRLPQVQTESSSDARHCRLQAVDQRVRGTLAAQEDLAACTDSLPRHRRQWRPRLGSSATEDGTSTRAGNVTALDSSRALECGRSGRPHQQERADSFATRAGDVSGTAAWSQNPSPVRQQRGGRRSAEMEQPERGVDAAFAAYLAPPDNTGSRADGDPPGTINRERGGRPQSRMGSFGLAPAPISGATGFSTVWDPNRRQIRQPSQPRGGQVQCEMELSRLRSTGRTPTALAWGTQLVQPTLVAYPSSVGEAPKRTSPRNRSATILEDRQLVAHLHIDGREAVDHRPTATATSFIYPGGECTGQTRTDRAASLETGHSAVVHQLLTRFQEQLLPLALRTSTQHQYRSHWQRFLQFCSTHQCRSLPASPSTIRAYVAQLSLAGAFGTLDNVFAAINYVHRAHGYNGPCDGFDARTARAAFQALARQQVPRKQRLPLPAIHVKQFMHHVQHANVAEEDGSHLWVAAAAIVHGFAFMERAQSIMAVKLSSYQELGEVLVYTQEVSKVRRSGEEKHCFSVPFSVPWTPFLLEFKRRRLAMGAKAEDTMFQRDDTRMHKSSPSAWVVKYIAIMQETLDVRPPEGGMWSPHSLRKGGATAAAVVHVPTNVIKRWGDWKLSSQEIDTYVNLQLMQDTEAASFFFGFLR